MHILYLPNIILVEIFEWLSYDEVSKNRLVCQRFDLIAQQVLNGGFNKIIKQHNISFKRIKALLPRRESERRNHFLARHADILTSIETRISMLSETYTKYMDLNLCCFIPGRVLDEIFRIFRLVSKINKPLRPYEVLQELRDISSMAIEHFEEKIAHNLKKTFEDSSKISSGSGYCSDTRRLGGASGLGFIGGRSSGNSLKAAISNNESLNTSLPSTSSGACGCHQNCVEGCPEVRTAMIYFKNMENEYRKSVVKMHLMQHVQSLLQKRLHQTVSCVAELSVQMIEFKKRLEDVDAKNHEISAVRHITGGEPTKADNINDSINAKLESNNTVENETLSFYPSTSTSASNNNPNKRRLDAEEDVLSISSEDNIEKLEDNYDLLVKKPKFR